MKKQIGILAILVGILGIGGFAYYQTKKMTSTYTDDDIQIKTVRVLLTTMYAEAKAAWAEEGKYPPSIENLKMEPKYVQQYNLQYQVSPDGQSFLATAEHKGQRLAIDQNGNIVNSASSQ